MRRICFLMGVSGSAWLTRVVLLMIVCVLPLACNRSGGGMGNNSTPNSANDQPQNKQAGGANNPGQKSQSDPSMPADTVSGKPSTASDNGSPAAVKDRSVAEPGAPEGTIEDKKRKQAPAAGSPNH
jgi:hypothetical protein